MEQATNGGSLEERTKRIEQFLDSYWKLSPELLRFEKFGYTSREHIQYLQSLRTKYGPEILSRLGEISSRALSDGYTNEDYDFLYNSGLSDDVDLANIFRARKTLKFLLNYLSDEKKPFSMADLGCGDGKIAIGLALYFDNLQKIYAMDRSHFALERMGQNIQSLSIENQENIRGRLVHLVGYIQGECPQGIRNLAPEGLDLILLAYVPFDSWDLPILDYLTKRSGRLIICDQLKENMLDEYLKRLNGASEYLAQNPEFYRGQMFRYKDPVFQGFSFELLHRLHSFIDHDGTPLIHVIVEGRRKSAVTDSY